MKILFTGGGTGGHFYPLIAIAEKVIELAEQQKIIDLKLYYMADDPYDKRMLFDNKITFVQVKTGKRRTYSSILNFIDLFKTALGAVSGLITMFFIFPDVVVSKGGYAAFPAVFAAKFLGIPVVLHESDSYPGRLNLWTAKFAKRIAVSWPEAAEYLPKSKTAHTGQPIRRDILHGTPEGSHEYFKLSSALPVILVIGGSQGAEKINDAIIAALPELLSRYQIIHQAGKLNFNDVVGRSKLVMENNPNLSRYVPLSFLNNLTTKMAAGCADLVITRAGSALFEIASWGTPAIVIPITNSNGDHQRKNAFNYARTGACEVIEESNLTPHVLVSEIDNIINNKEKMARMKKSALTFSSPDAASKIAEAVLEIALSHDL